MDFVHLGDLLGFGRMEDLLFKCNQSLIGKATNVTVIKEACSLCDQPNIIAWTYLLNGEMQVYRVSNVCSACTNKKQTQNKEVIREAAIEGKWYHVSPNDSCGFKNYESPNKVTENALKKAQEYTKRLIDGEALNLLMIGSTGTGKTHLAKTIAKTIKIKGKRVAYLTSIMLFDLLKETFGNDRFRKKFDDDFFLFDLVVIDDVGLETKKRDEVSWTVTEWTRLIELRTGKSTVYTTNLDDFELPKVIGNRAFSRMYDNTLFIDLFTDDYRKRLKH